MVFIRRPACFRRGNWFGRGKVSMGARIGMIAILLVLGNNVAAYGAAPRMVFDVVDYGAVQDERVDSTQAFAKAWDAACEWEGMGRPTVLVPLGVFVLSPIDFVGPCKVPVSFALVGELAAHPDMLFGKTWITFRYVHRLSVTGRGSINGRGNSAWNYNNCRQDSNCKSLPVSVSFNFVTNSRVRKISLIDSKNTHMDVFGCSNLDIDGVRISAPGDSPNTDGIRIGQSHHVRITRTTISTGDDCIAMLGGSRDIQISDVSCGPGHGISIGSLGKYADEANVTGVSVRRVKFTGTLNGVRIKSWPASPSFSSASNVTFQDLEMNHVDNPIVIDQEYCIPHPPCSSPESPSKVQISDVTYQNIRGTSTSPEVVQLRCSQTLPCMHIKMRDIDLSYVGEGATASSKALCVHVDSMSSDGLLNPPVCS